MQKTLLKLIKRYHGALILEDIIAHKTRRLLVNFCGTLSLFLLVGAIFASDEVSTKLRGGFLGFFLLFLFFLVLEAYFYSAYKARRVKKDLLSFEAARMVFYAQDDDLTVGFLYCDTGDEAMKRLGFDEGEIGQILRDRPAISFSGELLDLSCGANLHDFLNLIYEKDLFLQHALSEKSVSFEDFFHTVKWVLEKEEKEIFDARWWSMEKLQRIPPIGKTWSHREIVTLNQYSTNLTESGLSHFASFESLHDSNVLKIESALSRKKNPNVFLVTEEVSLGSDLIFMLARRIRESRSLRHISRSRVFLLNSDILLKNSYNKISFEKEFSNLLSESKKARNVILVFPSWVDFEKKARGLGADAFSVLKDFLDSSVHFIFLETKKDFEENLSKNQTLLSHFETIMIEESDNHYLESFLENELIDIEAFGRVVFTYKSIKEIAKLLKKDFKSFDFTEKARDYLVQSTEIAKQNKRKFVVPEDVLSLSQKNT
ncbi:MAG: ATPase with chaperone, ATP-binding subunit [Patescibacteria group bacterium]|nr:ATPase with chaperone, ATP-binding subunit [Patescibacteria group bacterium]